MATRRQSFEIAGFSHGDNPIPAVCRIGNVVMTGGIYGVDLATGKLPETLEAQTQNMFQNAEKILAAAGARFDDVLKVVVYLKPDLSRAVVNKEWIRYFPDPHSRPVRHTLINPYLPGAMLVQCEIAAALHE